MKNQLCWGVHESFSYHSSSDFTSGTVYEMSCLCVASAYPRTMKETLIGRLVVLPFSHLVQEPFLSLHCLTSTYLSHLWNQKRESRPVLFPVNPDTIVVVWVVLWLSVRLLPFRVSILIFPYCCCYYCCCCCQPYSGVTESKDGYHTCEHLSQVREFIGKWVLLEGRIIASTVLWDFWSSLLLKPKVREVYWPMDLY
jgi:hypothetical protein